VADRRPVERQVPARTHPDLQHETACRPDSPRRYVSRRSAPIANSIRRGKNPALIETQYAILGEIKGAAGLAYLLGSTSASFRSGQQACRWRCRGTSDSIPPPATPHRRTDGRMGLLPACRRADTRPGGGQTPSFAGETCGFFGDGRSRCGNCLRPGDHLSRRDLERGLRLGCGRQGARAPSANSRPRWTALGETCRSCQTTSGIDPLATARIDP
jgi:hypothetical protein